jgi:cytochrome c biogenesis protein CcdA/thiol-disulfide isomerase/thioredoxin
MLLLIGAFIAGMLTVLAPCALPLLPVIIGGSLSGANSQTRRRPLIITTSLAASLIAFTLLLKATTVLVNLPPTAINYISGAVIILLGLAILFPFVYEKLTIKIGFTTKSQELLEKGREEKNSVIGAIIFGAALGPVFSSCSPVYAYIIATVLPASFSRALTYIVAYVLGLCFILFLIALYSSKLVSRLRWASNPRGVFQRALAIIFIIVGILVFTGTTTDVQTWVSNHTPFDFDALSSRLVPDNSHRESRAGLFNVQPYDAPDFVDIDEWINSDPLSITDLRGKVVLVDFWTYSCINCIRTQPYLRSWYNAYKDDGFVIVGVHAPEFSFEKVPKNVRNAVKKAKLTYPIALDNNLLTWSAYENQYWPASYLIDAKGQVRRVHFGEGEYNQEEKAIRALLEDKNGKTPTKNKSNIKKGDAFRPDQTPETYLGTRRAENFVSNNDLVTDTDRSFDAMKKLEVNQWSLGGSWDVEPEAITAKRNAKLYFRIAAKEVYLVGGAEVAKNITVKLDGKLISNTDSAGHDVKNSKVAISESQLYRLVSFKKFTSSALLELDVPAGVTLNSFTFGS